MLDDVDEERDAGVTGTLDGKPLAALSSALARRLGAHAGYLRARTLLHLRHLGCLKALDHLDLSRADNGAGIVDHLVHATDLIARFALLSHTPAFLWKAIAHIYQHAALTRELVDAANIVDVRTCVGRIGLGVIFFRRGLSGEQHQQRKLRREAHRLLAHARDTRSQPVEPAQTAKAPKNVGLAFGGDFGCYAEVEHLPPLGLANGQQ